MVLYCSLLTASVATLDFDDPECFEAGDTYTAAYLKPTDTDKIALGVSLLDAEGRY
jgi:hypothetical protein